MWVSTEITSLANHWNYYPGAASFTVNSVKQAGTWSLHSVEPGTSDCLLGKSSKHLISEAGWFGVIFPVVSQTCISSQCYTVLYKLPSRLNFY